jgi:4-amino-4-deoxy-L-arabinose transferase-like glycosyltransferase
MVALAFALRLIVMGLVYQIHLDPSRDHISFAAEMGRVARSIATGRGFSSPFPDPSGPTAHVTPVFPYLLAGVFKLFGVYTAASDLAILTINNLISALTCVPVFLIGRQVFGLRVATWAGWIWAVFPYSLDATNNLIWETSLTTFLLTLLVWTTLRLERSTRLTAWIGYGLLWGFGALTNPVILSTLPFLLAWIWFRRWRQGEHFGVAAAVVSLTFLAVTIPWIWRCSEIYGRFVFFRSNFGLEVMVGNSDSTVPENVKVHPTENQAEMKKVQHLGEPVYMAQKQREAMDFIEAHPLRYAELTLRRILNTWTGLWEFPPHWTLDELGLPHILTYTFFSILALFGLGMALHSRVDEAVPLVIVVICFPVVYYLTHPGMRYRLPIDPVLVIFFTYGATLLRWRPRESCTVKENAGILEESIPD